MPTILMHLFRLLSGKLATAFIVSAERSREYYLSVPKLIRFPVFSLPAPVDAKKFDLANSQSTTCVAEYSGIRVLSVANINHIKGIDYLIDAAKLLLDSHVEGYSFVVAGPVYDSQKHYFATLLERIARLGISDRFHFIGEVEDVPAIMAAADIYVCSSRAESSPMAVWEAMAMERAVVSTDVGDVARYLRTGECGYVVPVGEPRALANAIRDLASRPTLRREFGKRAREVVLRELEVGVVGARTATCYRQVVDSSYIASERPVGAG